MNRRRENGCKKLQRMWKVIQLHFRSAIVSTCAKALDAKFEEVKAYVYEHPRVDIQEVAEVLN